MTKYLVTIQAYVDTDFATTAENIALETVRYLEEANETPGAAPTTIQTCLVLKAPFRPEGPYFWAGASCEADIEAEAERPGRNVTNENAGGPESPVTGPALTIEDHDGLKSLYQAWVSNRQELTDAEEAGDLTGDDYNDAIQAADDDGIDLLHSLATAFGWDDKEGD